VINDRNGIIGYTTGVFDLFHIGHLTILRRAKEQCDYLIVGVSTDNLVRAYKNKSPVIPFEERIAIVESIKYVDQVVVQEDRDKVAAWRKYHFDIMFCGDDWRGNALFEEAENALQKEHVRIVYFPYTQGVSSTLRREQVQDGGLVPGHDAVEAGLGLCR
jgi:glycerol-3-phosphate cytidylyltransferase